MSSHITHHIKILFQNINTFTCIHSGGGVRARSIAETRPQKEKTLRGARANTTQNVRQGQVKREREKEKQKYTNKNREKNQQQQQQQQQHNFIIYIYISNRTTAA